MAAAAAGCALALLTVPMLMSGRSGVENVSNAVLPENAVCKEGLANFDFTLKDPDGAPVRMADHKGKVVMLNFWGTWCPPCRREIPDLIAVQDEYRDKGFVILGVAFEDTAEAVKDYAAEMKINYPLAMAENAFEDAYGPVYGLPISLFIARDGSICKKHLGEVSKEGVWREQEQAGAVRTLASSHRLNDLRLAPGADAGFDVRRYVPGVNNAMAVAGQAAAGREKLSAEGRPDIGEQPGVFGRVGPTAEGLGGFRHQAGGISKVSRGNQGHIGDRVWILRVGRLNGQPPGAGRR